MKTFKSINYITIIKLVLGGLLIFGSVWTLIVANGNDIVFEEATIVPKGVVIVDSQPSNVRVYLNNIYYGDSNNELTNIDIGSAILRLEREGFVTLERSITVKENQITRVSAQLFPESLNLTQLNRLPIEYITNDNNRIYYIVDDQENTSLKGLWLYERSTGLLGETNTSRFIGSFSEEITEATNNADYAFIIKDTTALLTIEQDNAYLLTIADNDIMQITTLQELIGFYPKQFELLDGNTLLVEDESIMFTINITTGIKTLLYFDKDKPVPQYAVFENQIFYKNIHTSQFDLIQGNTVTSFMPPGIAANQETTEVGIQDVFAQVEDSQEQEEVEEIIDSNQEIDVLGSEIAFAASASRFILKDASGLIIWDINTNALQRIPESNKTSTVVDASTLGNAIIFQNESSILTAQIENDTTNNSYVIKVGSLPVLDTTFFYSIAPNNTNIIHVFQSNEDVYTIAALDFDGNNSVILIQDIQLLSPSSFYISEDSRTLFLAINSTNQQDSGDSTGETEMPRAIYNLYEVGLF